MVEPIDVYSDQFQVNLGPYGCTLNFMLSSATPPAPGSVPQAERMATIRMSLQHLKVVAFVLRRQILLVERETGVKTDIPMQVLNSVQISREDWDAFWKGD
jgi:hypothetical protein